MEETMTKGIKYPLEGMTDYQRLKMYGWEMFHRGRNVDYFRKRDWIAVVPISTNYPIRFERNGKLLKSNKQSAQVKIVETFAWRTNAG